MKKKLTQEDVYFAGDKLIIPEALSGKYAEARDLIAQFEQANETPVNIFATIKGFPQDILAALAHVLKERYGFNTHKGVSVTINKPDGTKDSVPFGKLAVPAWGGGYIDTSLSNSPEIIIEGRCARKHEADVRGLLTAVEEHLKSASIYRGQAFRLNLDWLVKDELFNVENHQPQFMGTKAPALILNTTTEHLLSTALWLPIERRQACLDAGIPIRRGVLLSGPYGCGKTLTAGATAARCVKHGVTFIYLQTPKAFAYAYRLAALYAPAVLFCEDIDSVLDGQREGQMNDILNTLSGVDTKNLEIITCLTTNHIEAIHPAFLRAERIDRVIHFGPPDSATAARFVEHYAKDAHGVSFLHPTADCMSIGKALDGASPAFIRAAVEAAKANALFHGRALLTTEDVVVAAHAYDEQRKLVERAQGPTEEERVVDALMLAHKAATGNVSIRKKMGVLDSDED